MTACQEFCAERLYCSWYLHHEVRGLWSAGGAPPHCPVAISSIPSGIFYAPPLFPVFSRLVSTCLFSLPISTDQADGAVLTLAYPTSNRRSAREYTHHTIYTTHRIDTDTYHTQAHIPHTHKHKPHHTHHT